MRKIAVSVAGLFISMGLLAQDSLKTITLNEVVTIGTKIDVPVEKSGKTIVKLTGDELQRNTGKSIADVLNEVPGIQMDGNFSAPGSNISYYVRGGRSKTTLILIDGVPLNDPSGINAEFDLRYLPISQVESIEILKGGLSTLYGTGAAAGVIDIRLKENNEKPFGGKVDLNAGSYRTYGQNISVGGKVEKLTYSLLGSNLNSVGFSAALDVDGTNNFDKDGLDRQNGLLKLGYQLQPHFNLGVLAGYDHFKADYDAYEFTDADNVQESAQFRVGVNSKYEYSVQGNLSGYAVMNWNERSFESDFPNTYLGKNLQAEIIQHHQFTKSIQGLLGINYQHMRFEEEGINEVDSTKFSMVDPFLSLLISHSAFDLHAGIRLNTHSVYGSKWVYNLNPSLLLNSSGFLHYKLIASISTSYITPTLYQLNSIYGNTSLKPEEAINFEMGGSVYGGEKFAFDLVWFSREESNPIDFVNIFDSSGDWIGGMYQNVAIKRNVYGVEIATRWQVLKTASLSGNYTFTNSDKQELFYRIPNHKFGISFDVNPIPKLDISFRYNFTGKRTVFDFQAYDTVQLDSFELLDINLSYEFLKGNLKINTAVNNLFDKQFVGVYGFTTRGRNFNAGVSLIF